jgi:hypothetical protein
MTIPFIMVRRPSWSAETYTGEMTVWTKRWPLPPRRSWIREWA